jgi:cell wall-associated NlpC family hydrolase
MTVSTVSSTAARPRRRRPGLCAAAFVACAAAVLVCLAPPGGGSRALASPTVIVASKPATLPQLERAADKVQRQVAALDDRLEVVIEDWDAAESQLQAVEAQLGDVRLQLSQAQDELTQQQAVLGAHLAWMYKLGDYGLLDELLNGGSLTSAGARLELFRRVNEQDQSLRAGFLATVQRVDRLETEISIQRDKAMAAQQKVDAERLIISDRLAQRQAILDGLNGRIATILDERARAAALSSGRLARVALAQLGTIAGTQAQIGVVRTALRFLGVPYLWGGASPSGFDCSGLVMYVYARYGVQFPHFAAWQAEMGTPVPESQLEPADLVFFGDPILHVVIYAGNGLVVQAPHTGDVVKVSRLSDFGPPAACRRYALQLP